MDKARLLDYLARIDTALTTPAELCVYGSAACILLDEPDRTSLDLDVAGPYCNAVFADLQRAAEQAGLPVNPDEAYGGDHIEWMSAARLCLAKPEAGSDVLLWKGRKLTLKTVPIPHLIASKLIRYDEVDQADIQYLCAQSRVTHAEIEQAAGALPPPFARDTVLQENLKNLAADMNRWGIR